MKLTLIFAILSLCVIVKGTWWAAAVQPVILSLGAVLTTINQDVLDVASIQLKTWLPFINKSEETPKEQEYLNPK